MLGVAAAQLGMAQRPDSTGALGQIRCPTLVLVGELDTLTPPDLSRSMAAAIPGARLALIPGAGHLANLEEPAAFNRAVADFLTEICAARASP